ncbi:hypothetical protein [Burkholderia alba]|uniref:hypothetical protein n=1 Tax=Burkholderia alba TaxID=2683677 RepID=UPI002B051EEB|nr:hypothetical protein [Burkholderia alba]
MKAAQRAMALSMLGAACGWAQAGGPGGGNVPGAATAGMTDRGDPVDGPNARYAVPAEMSGMAADRGQAPRRMTPPARRPDGGQ